MNIDNKTKAKNQRKPTGQKLYETAMLIRRELEALEQPFIIIREAMLKSASSAYILKTLAKVVGVSDLSAWISLGTEFVEIQPADIKKALTDNGRAEKNEIAKAVQKYVVTLNF